MSSRRSAQGGLSLIEAVVFIVVVGIGIAGVVMLYGQVTRASVDPVVRKQALAIATSLMEEIQLRAFTFCDPEDANVYTATGAFVGAGGCAAAVEGIGPEAGETRYGPTLFDNVNDYQPFQMLGSIQDITGTTIAGLAGYSADVSVAQPTGAEILSGIPASEQLKIVVTVTGPADVTVSLQGYRTRYAPNSP
jgi:MSHA pilin protein MshD